jgi:hypothetical protein
MKQPEDVGLSREEGAALSERLARNALSAEDRRLLVKILPCYFWVLFALREAKLSLKRLKTLVLGEKPKKPKPPSSGGTAGGQWGREGTADHVVTGSVPIIYASVITREETASTGTWAARSRGVSGGADSRVSACGVSGGRALPSLRARAPGTFTAGRGDGGRWKRPVGGGAV